MVRRVSSSSTNLLESRQLFTKGRSLLFKLFVCLIEGVHSSWPKWRSFIANGEINWNFKILRRVWRVSYIIFRERNVFDGLLCFDGKIWIGSENLRKVFKVVPGFSRRNPLYPPSTEDYVKLYFNEFGEI